MISIETNLDELVGFEEEAIQELNLFPIGKNELEEIGNIVVDDIREGIDSGVDIRGTGFVKNTSQWVARKGHSKVLLGKTGRLYASFKRIVYGDEKGAVVEISATGNGLYWQTNPKNPRYKRDFFGISERALLKIKNFLEEKFSG